MRSHTQIPKPTTAIEYCWLFAAACVCDDSFLKEGKVTLSTLELLQQAIEEKVYPPQKIVLETFKRPFWTLKEKDWSLAPRHMLWYWIDIHRSKYEKTPTDFVQMARPLQSEDRIAFVYTQKATLLEFENIHGFSLQKGELAYTHGDILALPCEWVKN